MLQLSRFNDCYSIFFCILALVPVSKVLPNTALYVDVGFVKFSVVIFVETGRILRVAIAFATKSPS